MTKEEIEKKAYEVYPIVLTGTEYGPYAGQYDHDKNEDKREAYIKGLTEQLNYPKIKGWVARDGNRRLTLFENKPKFKKGVGLTPDYWTITSGSARQLFGDIMPEVNVSNSPIEVELSIKKI